MKNLLLTLSLASASLAGAAAENAPFSGKWAVHTSIAGNEVDQDCTFQQEGGVLSGSCTSERGSVEIKGKAEGNAVSWEYKSEYSGTPLVVAYKGKLGEDAKIQGSVSVDAFSVEGEFTAARGK